jgi:hypothetical protein
MTIEANNNLRKSIYVNEQSRKSIIGLQNFRRSS